MTKFTPGTWAFEPMEVPRPFGRECSVRIFSHDPGPSFDFHIGLVVDVDRETREANARLIAAAPDLLNALKSAASTAHYRGTLRSASAFCAGTFEECTNCQPWKDVIAKAEGAQ